MEDNTKRIKTGGRQKGTPNKTTKEMRNFIMNLLAENEEQMREDLKNLKPSQRINVYLKLYSMIIPRATAISFDEGNEMGARELLSNIMLYANK